MTTDELWRRQVDRALSRAVTAFDEAFRRYDKRTAMRHVVPWRDRVSAYLRDNPNATAKEVADACQAGYTQCKRFIAEPKKLGGASPKEWRR